MLTSSQSDRLRVVLVGTRNPLNMGAAARAMSNFGFHDLRVVRPYEVAFREARSAVGAAALLRSAEEHKTLAEAVADCTLVVGTTAIGRRQLKQPVKMLEAGAKQIRKKLQSSRVAILFGSEKVGLSNTDLSHCNFLIHVPTRKEHLSMNLGQSVAVCLYELSRSALPEAIAGKPEAIKAGDLERVTQLVLEAATASGYVNDRSRPAIEQRVRRLLRRLRVPAEDTGLVLGILRQILWKLNQ